jgi:hypothetical protein
VKKTTLSIITAIVLITVMIVPVLAETAALPGSGWYSGETIQNVSSTTATINITAYDSSSSATYNIPDTIAPGASKVYLPNAFPGMPSGFQGSAVVSSSSDIRAIVNITNRYITSPIVLGDPSSPSPAAAIYQGVSIPNTTIYFPLAKNNSFNKTSTFMIQNAGTASATALATFKFLGVNYTYTTPSLAPGQMAAVSPSNARDAGNNPPPSGNTAIGSMIATSTQPLAGTLLESKTTEVHATVLQAVRAFTSADFATTIYIPVNKNNFFGRFTGLQVQNVSGGPVNVSVNYTQIGSASPFCAAGPKSDSHNALAAGESWTFPSSVLDNGCLASAIITANGNIVATVNESYTSAFLAANPSRFQESTMYAGFPTNSATLVLAGPIFKEDSFNKGTGLTIQNVSGSAANVTLTFKNGAGQTFVSNPQPISAGQAATFTDVRNKAASFWAPSSPSGAMTPAALGCTASGCGINGNFSVVVSSNQNIVGLLNESTYPFTAPRILQDKNNYEVFNLTAAP